MSTTLPDVYDTRHHPVSDLFAYLPCTQVVGGNTNLDGFDEEAIGKVATAAQDALKDSLRGLKGIGSMLFWVSSQDDPCYDDSCKRTRLRRIAFR